MTRFITVESAKLDTPSAYKMLTSCVVPRPVAWVTTIDKKGLVNIAPFSSYNYVCHTPPMLMMNIGGRKVGPKDSARNIETQREFTVNVATEPMLDTMHKTSEDFPPEVSEAEVLGIELLPGQFVKTPRIARSPVHMECRLTHIIPLGRGLATMYIGEVIAFHLSDEIYDGNRVASAKMRPVARLGGPFYAGLGEIFERARLERMPGD